MSDNGDSGGTLRSMPADEPLKPFGKGTLRELFEESRRLRKQSEELRKRMANLARVIDEQARNDRPRRAPPME